jgi:hypothetical protein
MQTKLSISRAFCGALALLLALQACGDDDNPTPPDDVTPTAGTGAKGGSGGRAGTSNSDAGADGDGESGKGGTKATGGTKAIGGTKPTTDGGAEPVGGGGEGPDPAPACDLPELGEDGCFNCPVNGETEQWLNRCVDSDCEPFDNGPARLPLLEADGSLPDLPT